LSKEPGVVQINDTPDTFTVSIKGNGDVFENAKPTFTVSISQALKEDLTVKLSNGGTVTVKAGETTALYTAPIQGDDVYKDGGPLSLTVTDATVPGKVFEDLQLSKEPGVVQINDTISEVTATLTANKHLAFEGSSITYTVTLSGPAGLPIGNHAPLTFTLSDGTKITIDANSLTGKFTVPVANDVYDSAPVTNSLTGVTGDDNFEKLTLDKSPVTTTIIDKPDIVAVSIEGNGPVLENAHPTFTIKINRALKDDLIVKLGNGDTVTVKAGETKAIYTAPIQGDDVFKDGGFVTATVTDATVPGKTFELLIVSPLPGVVLVGDTPSEVIATLTADKTSVEEGGTITYTVTLKGPDGIPIGNHAPLIFTLSDGTKITVAGNSLTGSITVPVANTDYVSGPIVNGLAGVTGDRDFEKLTLDGSKVTTTVVDTPDTVTVSIKGNTVSEGTAPTFTISVSQKLADDLIVTLSNGKTVTIKAGETSTTYAGDLNAED
ncbi:surface adhesion protein, partial [Pseudomonas sp. ok602]